MRYAEMAAALQERGAVKGYPMQSKTNSMPRRKTLRYCLCVCYKLYL